jgi:3-dehydroquinate dehydratase-1
VAPNPLITGLINPVSLQDDDSIEEIFHCAALELRFDQFPNKATWPEIPAKLSGMHPDAQLIATIRLDHDGGKFSSRDLNSRAELFKKILATGEINWIDIELEHLDLAKQLAPLLEEHEVSLLVSHHNFTGSHSLDEMVAMANQALAAGAQGFKLALNIHNPGEEQAIYHFANEFRHQFQNLSVFSMGDLGRVSRIISPLITNEAFAYGYLGLKPSAPGQWSVPDLRFAFDTLLPEFPKPNWPFNAKQSALLQKVLSSED